MPATRKLAAILIADVVGYSRLMGEDEAGTARAVREHREAAHPIVARHGGRIVTTAGDGLLLEFASIVAGVECAIAIQALMLERNADTPEPKRILYRIGVNLGDVLIEGDDILGDGVNIAARLESICEPGGILISGAAYDQVRSRVEAPFVYLGEKALKNIVRPVRVYAVKSGAEDQPPAASPASISSQPDRPRLSIVVLPFENIGGDPGQEYFVDGVTESLTTDLSRARGVVIARNTAFTFKGNPIDVMRIGRELNVRYALEGSVQRHSDRMRVNVQLVDAESGNHLWAERYDKPVADFFDMQDEIVTRLANQLRAKLVSAEASRSERAPSPDSLDLLFQGAAWLNKGPTSENLMRARAFFERALALDPNNVLALVEMAFADFLIATYLFPEDRVIRLERSEAASIKALSLAPENASPT
jgi:TolB-like protein/class 3 adenylate cyclase